MGEQLVEAVIHQKLGRIAGIVAAADEVEVLQCRFLVRLWPNNLPLRMSEAELEGKAEESVKIAFAHIGIDKQDAFARLRHCRG